MRAEKYHIFKYKRTKRNCCFLHNHKVLYYNLLTSGKLDSYLADIEQQAQHLFLRLVKDLAEKENVTEELKATDMVLWVQKVNNIRNRAMEIVNAELIYI